MGPMARDRQAVFHPRLRVVLPAFLALLPAACGGPGDEVEIEGRRVASSVPPAWVDMPSADRFGRGDSMGSSASQDDTLASRLHYDLPRGWLEITPTPNRLINLVPGGDEQAACYVTVLGGDGGGLVANLNRWRAQVGLGPAPDAELLALPTIKLLGGDATLIELQGTFTGMDGVVNQGWGLTGCVVSTPQATIFVKMTGPAELTAAEREGFLSFVSSIAFDLEGDDHAGHDHAPGEGHEHEDHEPQPEAEAAPEPQPEPEVAAAPESFEANGFRFQLPSGWSDAGPRMMRELNFTVGEDGECYLTVLGGTGGGLEANLNRWRGQMGLEPASDEELAALPRIGLLGGEAHFLRADGDFTGMDGIAKLEMTLLGVALVGEERSLFVKLVAPTALAEAQEPAFRAFVEGLEEVAP
jgi:hypothetical protein